MPGFRSDHINLIADNLRDRYKSGFPILKELIQNADDAHAKQLAFGYHTGFLGKSKHLLLQGPALWVFNDGEFKESDKRAIQSFGLNSKAGDSGAIGKFGLGMKSVFHLCEAFFYVAFDGNKYHSVILNPWHDSEEEDTFHNKWEEFCEDDQDLIRKIVTEKKLDKGSAKSWLLLWVPLRRRSHVPEKGGRPYGAIVDNFLGDSEKEELTFLNDSNLSRRISAILPQLRSLESIAFSGGVVAPSFNLKLNLDKDSKRVDHLTSKIESSGSVEDSQALGRPLKFIIQQTAFIGEEPFSSLKALNAWPKTRRQNDLGLREQVSDKSEAEGAVMIAHADADVGKLQIQWAVFLPTDEGVNTYEFRLKNSSRNYQIVLHGQFFVDAGRRGIAGFRHLSEKQIATPSDIDDADLHIAWNQAVAQNAVLPEFIPTLDKYASKYLKDLEIEELTQAIASAFSQNDAGGNGSGFYSTYRQFICKNYAWVRKLTVDGTQWTCLNLKFTRKLLQLPAPPKNDPSRPWLVLPGLRDIKDVTYCDLSAPSLAPSFDDWDEESMLAVIKSIADGVLIKDTSLKYLVDFLEMEQRRYIGIFRIQMEICRLLQKVLRSTPVEAFRSVRTPFQSLVGLLKPEYRVSIGAKTSSAGTSVDDSTLKLLICCDTKLLILPSDLDPPLKELISTAHPDDDDMGKWMVAIEKEISKQANIIDHNKVKSTARVSTLLTTATQLLDLYGSKDHDKARIIRTHRHARILTAIDGRTGIENAVDFESLVVAHQNQCLFKQGGLHAKIGFAKQFACVLKENRVWVISAEISKYIEDDGKPRVPSADDGKAILESLGKSGKPVELEDVESRRELIKLVHQYTGKDSNAIRGLRYLLHASPQGFMDDNATLWIEPGSRETPWVKLWREIEPDCWNVLEANLASHLTPDEWPNLGISSVKDTEVLRKLNAVVNFSTNLEASFSESERETILGGVLDEGVWRRLPLHKDTNGIFGAIDTRCFLENNQKIPATLVDCCRIIVAGKNRDYLAKQNQLIPNWTAEKSVAVALQDVEPVKHWKLIIDALGQLSPKEIEDISDLKKNPWLPLSNGSAIRPEDVIDIEILSDDIDMISSHCEYCYSGVNALIPEIKQHVNFQLLRPILASGNAALARLGQLMTEAQTLKFGIGIKEKLDESELNRLIPILEKLKTIPAWAIIGKAIKALSLIDVINHLLPELCKTLPLDTLLETLNEIVQLGSSDEHRAIFNIYLKQLVSHENVSMSTLSKISLMSRESTWQDPRQLCVGATGIAGKYILHAEHGDILAGLITNTSDEIPPASISDNTEHATDGGMKDLLDKYFIPWENLTQHGPIGAFLALLGLSTRAQAENWLAPHSFERFSELIEWKDPGRRFDGAIEWMGGKSVIEALNVLEPKIKISIEDKVEVLSITGEKIFAELDSSFDTILVGKPNWNGGYSVSLSLRNIPNIVDMSALELSMLLRKTCEFLLNSVYNQKKSNLQFLWAELEKSDQLSLVIARDLILESLPFYLQQLKVASRNPNLETALNDLRKLQKEKSEASNNHKLTAGIEESILKARESLANLMATNKDVQKVVLDGVKKRVKQNQYEVSSIVFEIFQNADDAVHELQALRVDDGYDPYPVASIGRFVSEIGQDKMVRLVHWGRPINYTGHGKARKPAYQDDLEKMLILSASDKDEVNGVTGKFGLGFKSVLLATDSPRILSADLKFEIVGGCLPVPWTSTENSLNTLKFHRDSEHTQLRGTLLELSVPDPKKLLSRFNALAGVQVIFSREIRTINADGEKHIWAMNKLIAECNGVELDDVRLPTKSGLKTNKLLVLRGKFGAIAVQLGSRGLERFSDKLEHPIPSIWVTGPTRESPAAWFILNGNFELDTGRGALPHGSGAEGNYGKAESLSKEIGNKLYDVVNYSRVNWDVLRCRMGLVKDISAAEFWSSFFINIHMQSMDDDVSESIKLLHYFSKGLLTRFVELSDEVPNGLPGNLACFIDLNKIKLSVSSGWVQPLILLQKFPEFTQKYPLNGCADKDVVLAFHDCVDESLELNIPSLDISLLFSVLENGHCTPESASVFASIIPHLSPLIENEFNYEAAQIKFKAVDGSWQPLNNLLKSFNNKDEDDEALCLGFAPDSNKLHESYSKETHLFFDSVGISWNRSNENIATWILNANNASAKADAMRFMLKGSSANVVGYYYIKPKLAGSWLHDLQMNSPYLKEFDDDERKLLVAMLNPPGLSHAMQTPVDVPTALQGAEALMAIHRWWSEKGPKLMEEYYRNFWPSGIDQISENKEMDRSAWMTLFSIGLMQRIGRVKNFQNRGFIDTLITKGWWHTFCNERPQDAPQDWMNVLKKYGESHVEDERYSLWMDMFPRLYRIAHWLEEYKHVFLSIDDRSVSELASYLTPSADPVLSGSGINAPALPNSLRLGQHIVVRELLRANQLKSEAAKHLAYMPIQRVKNLLSQIGYSDVETSNDIFNLLDDALAHDAHFNHAYDIPLLLLSESSDLQESVLRISPMLDPDEELNNE